MEENFISDETAREWLKILIQPTEVEIEEMKMTALLLGSSNYRDFNNVPFEEQKMVLKDWLTSFFITIANRSDDLKAFIVKSGKFIPAIQEEIIELFEVHADKSQAFFELLVNDLKQLAQRSKFDFAGKIKIIDEDIVIEMQYEKENIEDFMNDENWIKV